MSKDSNSLIDFNHKRIEYLRNIYIKGENDWFSSNDIKQIMSARSELMFNVGLNEYNNKIIFVTQELNGKKDILENYNIIYIVFTKCFDFLLTYDFYTNLKEKFIHYTNLLYSYLNKLKDNPNDTHILLIFNSIKMLTFDIQTLMIDIYKKNNNM